MRRTGSAFLIAGADIMHFELLPDWLIPGVLATAVLLLVYAIHGEQDRKRRRLRRQARRRRNVAHHRAWEWVKRQRQARALRLTDQRSGPEKREALEIPECSASE
jgi:hypothetical protein